METSFLFDDEIAKEYEELSFSEKIEIRNALKNLDNNVGWKYLQKILKIQARNRAQRVVLAVPENLLNCPQDYYERGEIQGLLTSISMHDTLVNNLDIDIEQAQRDAQENDNEA